jgi:general stress protein YciG
MSDMDSGVKGRGRGFASMDPEKRRLIAAKGGRAVDPAKRSFSKDRALAARAGSKGGKGVPAERRSFSLNKALAAKAGKLGGKKGPPA